MLQKVDLTSDVYAVCVQHALSNEKEEVMGLLIGEVDEENGISRISSCLILQRSDKRPDRVEISPEQLTAATLYAEELETNLMRPMRVLGWYHSHPHITVLPSQVDIRTQASYQRLDQHFVGLIFSVFPKDNKVVYNSNEKPNDVQFICFQSQNDQCCKIPVVIKESKFNLYNLETMVKLPRILRKEEEDIAEKYIENENSFDRLIFLHNKSHRCIALLHIADKVIKPVYEMLKSREIVLEKRVEFLKTEKQRLLEELNFLKLNKVKD